MRIWTYKLLNLGLEYGIELCVLLSTILLNLGLDYDMELCVLLSYQEHQGHPSKNILFAVVQSNNFLFSSFSITTLSWIITSTGARKLSLQVTDNLPT